MDLAWAGAAKRREMFGGGVAFVLVEAVLGIAVVQRGHLGVARRLGEDRGGGDRSLAGIAVDDGARRAAEARRARIAVDDGLGRFHRKRSDGAPHRQHRSVEDVEAVDLLDRRECHRPGDGALLDALGEHFAPLGREYLGIGQAVDAPRRLTATFSSRLASLKLAR